MLPVKLHLLTLNPPIDVCNSSNTLLLFLKCIATHKQIRYLFASMIKLEPADKQGTSKHSFWVLTTEIKSQNFGKAGRTWKKLIILHGLGYWQYLYIFRERIKILWSTMFQLHMYKRYILLVVLDKFYRNITHTSIPFFTQYT